MQPLKINTVDSTCGDNPQPGTENQDADHKPYRDWFAKK